jgi:ribosomal protein S8
MDVSERKIKIGQVVIKEEYKKHFRFIDKEGNVFVVMRKPKATEAEKHAKLQAKKLAKQKLVAANREKRLKLQLEKRALKKQIIAQRRKVRKTLSTYDLDMLKDLEEQYDKKA